MDWKVDIRQSTNYGEFLKLIGWNVEKSSMGLVFIKKIPILGSAIKIQRVKRLNPKEVRRLQKKHRAFLTILEPDIEVSEKFILKAGFKKRGSSYIPTKTVVVDISKDKKAIFQGFKKEARYCLRKSEGQTITETTDVYHFRECWRRENQGKIHILSLKHLNALKEAFGNDCLFVLSENGECGAVFLYFDRCAYYWIGFAGRAARGKLSHYQVIWKGILWAKSKKAKLFDLEGIYDSRYPKPDWIGFTKFKKNFGETEVDYPGSFKG